MFQDLLFSKADMGTYSVLEILNNYKKRLREYALGIRDCLLLEAESGKSSWTSSYHKK